MAMSLRIVEHKESYLDVYLSYFLIIVRLHLKATQIIIGDTRLACAPRVAIQMHLFLARNTNQRKLSR